MKNRFVCSCVILTFLCSAVAADAPPRFKGPLPTSDVQFARALSADGQVMTMIFDNLSVDTESLRHSLPNVVTKKFSFVLRPESTKDVCVTLDLRGFFSIEAQGSAALIVQSGGVTTLVDLNGASAKSSDSKVKQDHPTYHEALKIAKEAGFALVPPPKGSHDYFKRIETHVAAGKPLQVTAILLTEALSGDDNSAALLTIDSIDCTVEAAVESKQK